MDSIRRLTQTRTSTMGRVGDEQQYAFTCSRLHRLTAKTKLKESKIVQGVLPGPKFEGYRH